MAQHISCLKGCSHEDKRSVLCNPKLFAYRQYSITCGISYLSYALFTLSIDVQPRITKLLCIT